MASSMSDAHERDGQRGVSLLAIDQYMREVKHLSKSGREDEAELFACLLRAREEPNNPCVVQAVREARDRLVGYFQPLVIALAKKYHRSSQRLELLDLIQEGNIGLVRALDRYVPGPGHEWLTFIGLCVRQALRELVREQGSMVRIPRRAAGEVGWLAQEKRQLEAYQDTEATAQQLAACMKLPVERVYEMLEWVASRQVSSIEALANEEGELDQMRFMSAGCDAFLEEEPQESGRHGRVRQEVEALPARQREVVWLRYGFDGGGGEVREWPLVGEMIGVSANAASSSDGVARRRLGRVLGAVYEQEEASEELSA